MRATPARIAVDERQYSLTVPLSASTYNAYTQFVAAYGAPNARISLTVNFDANAVVAFTLGTFPYGVRVNYTGITHSYTFQTSGSNPQPAAWTSQDFPSFNAAMNGISANAEAAATASVAEYAGIGTTMTYTGGTIGIGQYPLSGTAYAGLVYQWTRNWINPPSASDTQDGLLWA